MGDIAIPIDMNSKNARRLQEEVEQYKQEVLEGLQIEEEGLTDLIRKKTKQPSLVVTPKSYNDPVDIPVTNPLHKNGQVLQTGFSRGPVVASTNLTQERIGKIQSNSREISGDVHAAEKPKKIRHRKRHVGGTEGKRHHGKSKKMRYVTFSKLC